MRIANYTKSPTLITNFREPSMNTIPNKESHEEGRDPIDAYLECTTYCSLGDKENDCRTICMERHLKASYF